jgi:hypothetical protein
MVGRGVLAILVVLGASGFGCGGITSAGPCPSVTVTVDASINLPADGSYGTGEACAQYCDSNHPVCRLLRVGQVQCVAGCG